MFAKIKILGIIAITLALGGAFLSCNNPATENSLRWKTTVDVPVNKSFQLSGDLDSTHVGSGSVVVDLGTSIIPLTSDVFNLLRKFTNHQIGYQIGITNRAGADAILYGILFREGDDPADWSAEQLYEALTRGSMIDMARRYGRINLLGQSGLYVPSGETGDRPISMPDRFSADLCSLLLGDTNLSWRWLARLSDRDHAILDGTADSIDVRLRIRFSGVNSFDSLLTF
jgi:hypothetical protein